MKKYKIITEERMQELLDYAAFRADSECRDRELSLEELDCVTAAAANPNYREFLKRLDREPRR